MTKKENMQTEEKMNAAGVDINALREQLLEEIRRELKAEGDAKKAQRTREDEERERWLNEYVSVQLFKDGKAYKDDLSIAVNGENCIIKRGVPVKIKRKFALVLEQSQRQDIAAEEYAEAQKNEYSMQAKMFNI